MDAETKKRCVLVLPDAGPLISLQKAGALQLLLKLDMPIVVVDAVYYELVIDPDKYDSDREIRDFVTNYATVQTTEYGEFVLAKKLKGNPSHFGEAAIIDFMHRGLSKFAANDPVLLLFEDNKMIRSSEDLFPPTVHFLSTTAFLKGMEELKAVESAGAILDKLEAPPKPRFFPDRPDGTDREAKIGSTWTPALSSDLPSDIEAQARYVVENNLNPRTLEKTMPWADPDKVRSELHLVAAGDANAWGIGQDAFNAWGERHTVGRVRTDPTPEGPKSTIVYDDY